MLPRIPHISRLSSPGIETPRLTHRPKSTPEETESTQVSAPNITTEENNFIPSPETNGVTESVPDITDAETFNQLDETTKEHRSETSDEPQPELPSRDVSTQVREETEDAISDADPSDDADVDEAEDEVFEPDPVSRRTQREPSAAREFDLLFAEWKATGDPRIRERLILMNRNLVSYIARRFMDRGEMSEDIVQQGLIGLINALDHFDPSRGVRFATFATPTIMGEIRRYFRDKSWGIRVPRRLQELNQVINSRIDELTQTLDRSPTYIEIARSLNLQLEEVVEALEMASVLDPMSIDEEVSFGNNDSPTTVGDQIGAPDPQLEGWGEYAALQAALEKLPEKERRVLEMVYFNDHSQVEVARQMNVSQMFVSRLQRRALAHLRELMNGHDI